MDNITAADLTKGILTDEQIVQWADMNGKYFSRENDDVLAKKKLVTAEEGGYMKTGDVILIGGKNTYILGRIVW